MAGPGFMPRAIKSEPVSRGGVRVGCRASACLCWTKSLVNLKTSMRSQTVQPMQLQFQGKSGTQDDAANRRGAHVWDIFELHMVSDSRYHLFNLFAREFQSAQDALGHFRADRLVSIKVNRSSVGVLGNVTGLATSWSNTARAEKGRHPGAPDRA